MTFEQRLDFKQTQTLVVTPQLQQAIRLLLLSNQELILFLEKEMDQNPLLEVTLPNSRVKEEKAGGFLEQGDTCSSGQDFDNVWTNNNIYSNDTVYRASSSSDSVSFIETLPNQEIDLRTHLVHQIKADFSNPEERKIAFYCCDLLNESGYFLTPLSSIAQLFKISEEKMESLFRRLQQLEPVGVFSRSLKECLRLQLEDRGKWDSVMAILVNNLEFLAEDRIKSLEKMCGVGTVHFHKMIKEIRCLNPKPGALFGTQFVQSIVPDVIVEMKENGVWEIRLNEENFPRVRVDKAYYDQFKESDPRASAYVKKYFSEAQALVKAVQQRAETLLKVSRALVVAQKEFFKKGIEKLRPLTLKEIADDIDMHESTISRVTTNKFISTPRGIFELKYFFSGQVRTDQEECSAEVVRHKIKKLVEDESPSYPFSDDILVRKLEEEGIKIARRTVAKYRDVLGIPSSAQRKREKRVQTYLETL